MIKGVCRALLGSALLLGCKRHHGPPPIARIWLGGELGCAQLKEGGITCWGAGAVADGGTALTATLTGKEAPVALGRAHACFGEASPTCFGSIVPLGASGPLVAGGDMTCAGTTCWGGALKTGVPPAFQGVTVTQVAIGSTEICGLTAADGVRCFGIGKDAIRTYLKGRSVTAVAVGAVHACALVADGTVMCWGENDQGQLGDGSLLPSGEPVTVTGVAGGAAIRAGARHTCVRTGNGVVVCWGDNRRHQLADGTTTSRSRPAVVPGITGATDLTVSNDSTCAGLKGEVRCWGANDHGQFGDRARSEYGVPTPLRAVPAR